MCTLTYIPVADGGIVTANRDEDPNRNSNALSEYENDSGTRYLIAKEPRFGGTNIAISKENKPVISTLLNGAFHTHEFGKTYRLSRGLMVLASLNYPSLNAFQSFDFNQIEPFTMVRVSGQIEELRWDGKQRYFVEKEISKPHIWSSAQLYSTEVRNAREKWFEELLVSGSQDSELMSRFHHEGGIGDIENDLVMNRNNRVRTVSITQSAWSRKGNQVHHWDLINKKESDFLFT